MEQLGIHIQKYEPRHGPYTLPKINSKWIANLSVKCKTIKLIDENIGKVYVTLDLAMNF